MSVAKKLSATALSQQLPFLLRLPTQPALAPYHRGTRRRRVRPTSYSSVADQALLWRASPFTVASQLSLRIVWVLQENQDIMRS